MCLYIKKRTTKMVAKKDIVVYKCIRIIKSDSKIIDIEKGLIYYRIISFKSPYHSTIWKIGIIKKSLLDNSYQVKIERSVDKGLHAYVTRESAIRNSYSNNIFEAIIPKGSEYYLGTNNEIVSNQMKIVKFIK